MNRSPLLPLLSFLLGPLAAQTWVDRGVPEVLPLLNCGAYDPVSDRFLIVDRWGGTWAATFGAGGVAWSPLPDTTLRPVNPVPVVAALAFDAARNRMLASQFSPTGSTEWNGDSWQPPSSEFVPNRFAFDTVRNVLVGIVEPYLGTITPVVERVGTRWQHRGQFAVPGRGPIAWDPVRGEVLMHGADAAGVWRTHTWNGTAWTLVASGTGPDTAHFTLATDAARNRVVAHGGYRSGQVVADTWEWDGTAWTLAATTGVPPVANRALAWIGSLQRVVAYGGVNSSPPETNARDVDFWAWDGASWTLLPVATPGWRQGHALVHDPIRHETVMFGGADKSGALGDTWVWDGEAWSARPTPLAPAPRRGHAMAFDSLRGVVLLFGGTDGTIDFSDLWQWNGTAWSPLPTSTMPVPRSSPAVAYDAARDRLVVFGGITLTGGWRNDTLEWNGSSWLPIATNPMPALNRPLMAYDAVRQVTLLHSAVSGANYEWNGANHLPSGGSPFAAGSSLWFDPVIGRVRSTVPSAYSGLGSTWSNGAWVGSTMALGWTEPIVHDVRRGQAFAWNGARTRVATAIPAAVDDAGVGCSSLATAPELAAHTSPAIGASAFGFDVHAPAVGVTLAAIGGGMAAAPLPLGGGCVWWLPSAVSSPLLITNAAGYASWTIAVPLATSLRGADLFGQGVVIDPQAPLGLGLTQVVRARIGD